MKANELMIGDWVKHSITGKIGKVYRICGNEYIAFIDGDTQSELVEPIQLTPEILKKNGILYEKQSYYYVIKDDKDLECTYYIQQILQEDWAIGVDIGAYDCSVFARVKYVHQLQHALRLCGINKEIEL